MGMNEAPDPVSEFTTRTGGVSNSVKTFGGKLIPAIDPLGVVIIGILTLLSSSTPSKVTVSFGS